MNYEQEIIASLARARVKVAESFAAVGEIAMARFNYQSAIEKLEMAKKVGPLDSVLDESIAVLKEEISKLGMPDHGQKGTGSLLEIEATKS